MAVWDSVDGIECPARKAFSITPDDGADLIEVTRAIYIGGDGNLNVVTMDGDSVIFIGLVAGSILPVRVRRVMATDTDATFLVGLY